MVEIIAAVVTTRRLPREDGFGLVLNHNAFFELGIVVFAAVASVHGNEHGIELVLRVLTWLVFVVGLARRVVKEGHSCLYL